MRDLDNLVPCKIEQPIAQIPVRSMNVCGHLKLMLALLHLLALYMFNCKKEFEVVKNIKAQK